MENKNVFESIRIRSLIFWTISGWVSFWIIASFWGIEFETPLGDVSFSILFYLVPSIWILWEFKSKNVDYKKIIGKYPAYFKWWWILGIVTVLILFSLGTFWLQYYLISFVDLSYVAGILNEPYFYTLPDTGSPLLYNTISVLILVIIAPVVEEFVFRGVLLQRFSVKWGTMWAVIVSSLIFGILHLDLMGASVFGFFMAILYIQTKTLLVPIVCHILNNLMAFAVQITEILVNGNQTMETVAQFQSDLWIGLLLLLISTPFVIYYMYKNWPKKDTKTPYSS